MRRCHHETPVASRTVSIMTRMIPRNESDCVSRSMQNDFESTPKAPHYCSSSQMPSAQHEYQHPPRISQTVPHYCPTKSSCISTPSPVQPPMQSPMQSPMPPPIHCAKSSPRPNCPGLEQFELLSYGVSQPKPPPLQHFSLVHQAFTAACGICGRAHRHEAGILPCSRCQQCPQQEGDRKKESSLKHCSTSPANLQSRGVGPSETNVAIQDMYQDNIREQPTRECSCGTEAKCMCVSSTSVQKIETPLQRKDTCVSFKINADEARKSVLKTMKADSRGSLVDGSSCRNSKQKHPVEPESCKCTCKACEDYYTREKLQDTVWTVKIMKDVGIMSKMDDHNVVDTQTNETRMITAQDLECLLPPENRYIPEEDVAECDGDASASCCKCDGSTQEPVKGHSQVTSTTNFPPPKRNIFLQTKQPKGKKKKKCVIM